MFRKSSQALRLRKSRRPGLYRPDVICLEERVMLSATSTVFALDQTNSSLALSGTFAGATLQQQGTGSLTTKYMGSLVAQWDLSAHTINFVQAGTAATALNSGTWQPAVNGGSGSALANYGGRVTIIIITGYAAVRGLVAATSTSSPLTLTGSGPSYSFPSTQTLTITAGAADYNAGSFGSGRADLSNNSASNTASAGTFADLANGMYRVTGPVNVTINKTIGGQSAVLHIIGTIVANATIPVVVLGHGTPDYSTSVVATQGPKNITDPTATLTDANTSAHIASMTVTLTNHPDGAQELLAANLTGTGLSGSYNASTGILAISGNATPAVYQNVLRSLTYENDSATPNTTNRSITVAVSDGTNSSVVHTSTVSVSAPMTGATHFSVAGFPSPITAGTAGSITVTALDASGHTVTGYRGTVHFTSSDGQAVLPTNYPFTAADNGVHTFANAVTLKTAATQSITATDTTTAGITGSQTGIVVNPAAAASLTVTGFPSPVTAGVAGNVTVTAKDAYNNVATGYTGTVHVSSSDGQAVLPANYPFTAADHGVHTFAVTLKTAATQSITATDTTTASITGTQSGIVVNPAATARFVVSAPANATAGAAFTITVTAKDAYGNTTPAYSGTVTFTSSDGQASLPASATLTNGVGVFSVTLGTAGSQTVTATDAANSSITGNATVNVAPGALDHFNVSTSVDNSGTIAGQAFDVTVIAQDIYNNTVTGYTGTITFSSQDPFGATLPADYTFQTSDMGQVTFAAGATLYTAGYWDVTVTDTTTGQGGTDYISVTAASAVMFQIVAPATASSGQAFDITVIAQDPYGNTDTNYQGTITFSTTDGDPGVVLPADYTFQPTDMGQMTFPGGVTLITVGDQMVTATDTTSGITGSATVTVTSPGPNTRGLGHARQHTAIDSLFAAGARDRLDVGVWAALADGALAHRGTHGHPVDSVLMDGLI